MLYSIKGRLSRIDLYEMWKAFHSVNVDSFSEILECAKNTTPRDHASKIFFLGVEVS